LLHDGVGVSRLRNGDLTGYNLGEYNLRELLGRGAVGSVYRAYQPSLNRYVAVKVLTSTPDESPSALAERFSLEARTFASLEHPHIVPIYDYGTDRGLSYIVMRLLTGRTLEERLRHRLKHNELPSLGEVSHLLNQIADALTYAHERNVIHRDVKSGNVMFDGRGRAYLVDFSIVKLLDDRHHLTADGLIIGTPALMPPEQWRGEPLTPAADQYALGAVIYELVTGKLPLEAATAPALMYRHLNDIPAPAYELRPDLPEPASRAISWALSKDPSDRYPSARLFAQAFAEAVADFRGDSTNFFTFALPPAAIEPTPSEFAPGFATRDVSALPTRADPTPFPSLVEAVPAPITSFPAPPPMETYTNLYGSSKVMVRRRPRWLAVVGGVGVGLLVVAACLGATVLGLSALLDSSGTLPTEAVQLPTSAPTLAITPTVAIVAPTQSPSNDLPTESSPPTSIADELAARGGQPADAASSPQETSAVQVADAGSVPSGAWEEGRVIWALDTSVRSVSFTEGGSQVLFGGNSDSVQRTVLAGGTSEGILFTQSDTIYSLAANGNRIVSGDASGTIRLWEQGQTIVTLNGHTGAVRQVAFNSRGTLFASVGEDGAVKVWEAASGTIYQSFQLPNRVLAVAFSPDGNTLATGGTGTEIALWDIASGTQREVLAGHAGEVRTLAFSPDGQRLASGSSDGSLRLWNVVTGEFAALDGHAREVFAVAFSPDGSLLVSGGADNAVLIWDAVTGVQVEQLTGHGGWVFDVKFAPDGQTIASAGGDGTVRLWTLTL
jgi:serine/threonine protein kinase